VQIVNKVQVPMNGFMLRGLLFEPGMADYVANLRGEKLHRDAFYLDDNLPFFGASSDAVEGNPKRPRVMHEFKTTTSRNAHKWGPPGSDEVEEACFYQCQWNMGINGATECHVWCLFVDTGEEPRHYVVPRNNKVIAELRAIGEAFWLDHVLARVPPSAVSAARETIHSMYPSAAPGKSIDATAELIALTEAYDRARSEEKAAGERKDAASVAIKSMLGDAESASWTGGKVTWKNQKVGEPKVNFASAFDEAWQHYNLPTDEYHQLLRKHTTQTTTGVRVLRATVARKEMTDGKQQQQLVDGEG
jgi:hypothetical protein